MDNTPKDSLVQETHDPLIRFLSQSVVVCVKILAILMVLVIWMSLIDVFVHLYQHLTVALTSFFNTDVLLSTLGDFLAVLIAIEIFLNIIFYLKKDAIHVPLVLATALTAVARKVIVQDYKVIDANHIYALAAVIFAVGLVYWLVTKKTE